MQRSEICNIFYIKNYQEVSGWETTGDVFFNVTFCDSKCDTSYGPKCLMDSILSGTNAIFGPSCDYTLGRTN